MRTRVKEMVENLAREYQRELAAAGTFVALEKLTAEIGDEFGRQLCENELLNRARWAAIVEQCERPECGLLCPRVEEEPMLLQGLRGEVAFSQRNSNPQAASRKRRKAGCLRLVARPDLKKRPICVKISEHAGVTSWRAVSAALRHTGGG
ncbi:MAG: hypothetical protein WCB27_06850 [Thermoguttaceae bacterium]